MGNIGNFRVKSGRLKEYEGVNIFRYLGKVRERDLAASKPVRP